MAGNNSEEGPRTRPRRNLAGGRNPRLRLACLRCQQRKIRCDGELPACKNCKNAGVVCADGESARLRDLPRAYITNLKSRISWLETIIRSRCPDVDLSQGPSVHEGDESHWGTLDDTTEMVFGSPTPSRTQYLAGPTSELPPVVTQTPVRSGPGQSAAGASALSHEIGLVSLGTNQDPRYIGPSSGYFLARVMLNSSPKLDERSIGPNRDSPFPTQLAEASQGALPLPSEADMKLLSDAYFDVIHPQYPILHRPTFIAMLNEVYAQGREDAVVRFQVFMVLGIGATILSARLRARIPGESYFLSALQYFDKLNLSNSLKGLQCLLLVLIFTVHSPSVRLNVWYLHYHCLAALLDLGLQRDINTQAGITLLEQEMRTRIFWVVLTMDRTIATMMGRPIGLRDEACELRMPQGLCDDDLGLASLTGTRISVSNSSQTEFAVHLFRATKLNSEIKYVANSIVRDAPQYAYPPVANINDWQSSMLQKLDQWADEIPGVGDASKDYLRSTCLLRYHGLRMLLLRPCPAIPKPSPESLKECHKSAYDSIRLFDNLYRNNLLVHSWMTFHSLVLSTITMLYCIKIVPGIARRTELEILMRDLSISLSVLSATGEHWSGAKRSRDILDELGRSTIRWLRDANSAHRPNSTTQTQINGAQAVATQTVDIGNSTLALEGALPYVPEASTTFPSFNDMGMNGLMQTPFDDLILNGSFAEYFEATDSVNVDNIVRDLFQDFIPTYPNFT
ncbi:Fc.00g107510.m01.CDS01 [Cosmosporella sp. VM-42]